MRIFFAGATGVIGQRLMPMLVEAGHSITALTRRPEKSESLRAAGATPVVGNALDAAWLRQAVAAARPDVLIHELTDIPKSLDPRKYATQMAANDRLRTEGTRNLIEAALAAGARRVVAQSVAFAYSPVGSWIKDEDAPLYLDAPQPFRRSVESLANLEDAVLNTNGLEGAVLRYGFFYGPGTTYASDGDAAGRVRKRRFPTVGDGAGMFSFIHVDDAATATAAALTVGSGAFNVVDDDPAPVRDWLPYYAEVLGAKRPFRVPAFIGRLAGGSFVVYGMTQLRGATNERAKAALDWRPRYASWREGFREALG